MTSAEKLEHFSTKEAQDQFQQDTSDINSFQNKTWRGEALSDAQLKRLKELKENDPSQYLRVDQTLSMNEKAIVISNTRLKQVVDQKIVVELMNFCGKRDLDTDELVRLDHLMSAPTVIVPDCLKNYRKTREDAEKIKTVLAKAPGSCQGAFSKANTLQSYMKEEDVFVKVASLAQSGASEDVCVLLDDLGTKVESTRSEMMNCYRQIGSNGDVDLKKLKEGMVVQASQLHSMQEQLAPLDEKMACHSR